MYGVILENRGYAGVLMDISNIVFAKLRVLDLRKNNISTIEPIITISMPQLRKLQIGTPSIHHRR